MKSVNWPKPGYASITCSTISNIPYNLIFTTKFNDSSILITIISCDYLNLSLPDEHVGDVTIPTQVIEYNQNFLQADKPIRSKYSNKIKLFTDVPGECRTTIIVKRSNGTTVSAMYLPKAMNEDFTRKVDTDWLTWYFQRRFI
jgi:hypothetical protein